MGASTYSAFVGSLKELKVEALPFDALHQNYRLPASEAYAHYLETRSSFYTILRRSSSFMEQGAMHGMDFAPLPPLLGRDEYERTSHRWPALVCRLIAQGQSAACVLSLMRRYRLVESLAFYRLLLARNIPELVPPKVLQQHHAVTALTEFPHPNEARKLLLTRINRALIKFEKWILI